MMQRSGSIKAQQGSPLKTSTKPAYKPARGNPGNTRKQTMKITKHGPGYYTATGYMGQNLTQYSLMKNGHLWELNRVYGNGPEFYAGFTSKAAAVQALNSSSK
jgi:hypothetical protein